MPFYKYYGRSTHSVFNKFGEGNTPGVGVGVNNICV